MFFSSGIPPVRQSRERRYQDPGWPGPQGGRRSPPEKFGTHRAVQRAPIRNTRPDPNSTDFDHFPSLLQISVECGETVNGLRYKGCPFLALPRSDRHSDVGAYTSCPCVHTFLNTHGPAIKIRHGMWAFEICINDSLQSVSYPSFRDPFEIPPCY